MWTGVVVGKFAPLHRGHQYLIDTALSHADRVVVISYSKPGFKGCEVSEQEYWFSTIYGEEIKSGKLRTILLGDLAPANDEPEELHREFCARVLSHYNITPDCVFSSEDYGNGFAQHLCTFFGRQVMNWVVDHGRIQVPISATIVRKNPLIIPEHLLHSTVASSFVPRIAILGGESTGKTTLANALAKRLDVPYIAEFGRTLYELKSGDLTYRDMDVIAEEQVRQEREVALTFPKMIICDTTPLTTAWYSFQLFNRQPAKLRKLTTRHYDLVIQCSSSIPFEQDGTRRDTEFREKAQYFYKHWYSQHGKPLHQVQGTVEERVERVLELIDECGILPRD